MLKSYRAKKMEDRSHMQVQLAVHRNSRGYFGLSIVESSWL